MFFTLLSFLVFDPQLRSYNRHTLIADPYEDGFGDLLIKKQKMVELEKKVCSNSRRHVI